jgi:hypothetical protein
MLPDDHVLKEFERAFTYGRCGYGGQRVNKTYTGDEILERLEAFAAAHPGLVDHTKECDRCGAPIGNDSKTERSAYGLFDDHEMFVTVFGDDHEAYDELYCIHFCLACFDELRQQQEWHAADVRPLAEKYGTGSR